MITEDYVSFEVAKLLKEKGFDGVTEKYYLKYKGEYILVSRGTAEHPDSSIDVPTLQMAMKWLRKVHNLYIEVSLSCDRGDKNAKIFDASIFNVQNQRYKKLGNIQGYEQACEAAIKYCLENLS
jgi:hypothetical protein